MLSYAQTLKNSPLKIVLSAKALAEALKVPLPTSIISLLHKLTVPETVNFSTDVVTGGLSGLGGRVDLTLNRDGNYKVHFQMWNSSKVTGYDYSVRSIFSSPNGMCLVSMHNGHVSAEDLVGSAANDFYDESGVNPMIKDNWSDIINGKISQSHEYSAAGGPLGELESLAKDIAIIFSGGLVAGAAGSALGVTIALTSEAGKVFGGIGETIAVIGGVVVFAIGLAAGATIGNALFIATVAGVGTGAVTDLALVKQRQMSQQEYDFANSLGSEGNNYSKDPANASVFMGNLPAISKLRVTNLCSPDKGRAFTIRGADNLIYLNLGAAFDHALDLPGNGSYTGRGQLLIHELVHAMQIDHGPTWGVICSGIVNQIENTFGDNKYKFGDAGPDWYSSYFNNESRAAIVDHWFAGEDKDRNAVTPMDITSQYFQYIIKNVRTGDMGTVDI